MMSIDQYIKNERKADHRRRIGMQKRPVKTVVLAIGLFAAMIIGVSLVHESGHAVVCASEGLEYRIWLDFAGGHTLCMGDIKNDSLSNILGPSVGLAAIAPIAVIAKKKNWLAVLPGAVTFSIDQLLKVGLEGFANRGYGAGNYNVILSVVQAAVFVGVLGYVLLKQRKA